MTEKIRITDIHGTAMEVTFEEGGFLRFVTDADRLPQGKGVWLSEDQVNGLMSYLAGCLGFP